MKKRNIGDEIVYNGISERKIPLNAGSQQCVRQFTIQNCQNIKSLENVEQYRQLQRLVAINNAITNISHLCDVKDSITYVDLSYNYIAQIHDVFQCHNLTHLNLSNNNIRSFEPTEQLQGLVYLNLKSNKIARADFSKLPGVRYLNVACNAIQSLKPLHLPRQLIYLNVQSNDLSDKADLLCLQDLGDLQFLLLADNTFRQSKDELNEYLNHVSLNSSVRVYLSYVIDDESIYTNYIEHSRTGSTLQGGAMTATGAMTAEELDLRHGSESVHMMELERQAVGPTVGKNAHSEDDSPHDEDGTVITKSNTHESKVRQHAAKYSSTNSVIDRVAEQIQRKNKNNQVQELRKQIAQQNQIIQRLQIIIQEKNSAMKSMSLSHNIEQFKAAQSGNVGSQLRRDLTQKNDVSLATLNQIRCDSAKFKQMNELQAKYWRQLRVNTEAQETIKRLNLRIQNLEQHIRLQDTNEEDQRLITSKLEKEISRWRARCEQLTTELQQRQYEADQGHDRINEQTQTEKPPSFNQYCQTDSLQCTVVMHAVQRPAPPVGNTSSVREVLQPSSGLVEAGTVIQTRDEPNSSGIDHTSEVQEEGRAPAAVTGGGLASPIVSDSQPLGDDLAAELDVDAAVRMLDELQLEGSVPSQRSPSEGSWVAGRPRKKRSKKLRGRARNQDVLDMINNE